MNKKIMLVDDDAALAEALILLMEADGFLVDRSDNGKTAAMEIRKSKPDLIILDYMLPGKNGIEVLKEVRQSGDGIAKIPIIMISASVNVRGPAKENGANHFLAKPFEIEELVDEINRLTVTL